MPIYDHLVGNHRQTNEEEPQLATDWSVETDGKTWTFNLRENVPFYRRGKPLIFEFGAQDVIHALNLVTQNRGFWSNTLGTFQGKWTAENDHRLTLELPRTHFYVPFLLSDQWQQSGIPSRSYWKLVGEKAFLADPVGSGPWSLLDFTPNVSYLHERIEDHWRKTPAFHELELLVVNDVSTRLGMLITGEVGIANVPNTLLPAAEGAGMVPSVSSVPGFHTQLIIPFYESYKPGFDRSDPMRRAKVRLALNHAIDREEINDTFFQGEGIPLVSYFPPWREDFLDEWAPFPDIDGNTGRDGGWPYSYDPDLGVQLLKEAGYQGGFETQIWYESSGRRVGRQREIVEAIEGYWEAIGIDTTLVASDRPLFGIAGSADVSNWSYFSAPTLDPICLAAFFLRGHVQHQELAEFQQDCDTTPNPTRQLSQAQELGTWWVENAISVPLLWIFFPKAAVNPAIVSAYNVNMFNMGPVRYHEWTKPVYQ